MPMRCSMSVPARSITPAQGSDRRACTLSSTNSSGPASCTSSPWNSPLTREARDFQPLQWFGPEVTADPRYTNQSIALRGVEQAPEIPLSDTALNGLIDTLDDRFPAQARVATTRPTAKQVPETKAKRRPAAETVKVNLDAIEGP